LGQTLSLESIANGVFGLADFTLNLASGPFGGTFGLGLPITGGLADGFLYGSLDTCLAPPLIRFLSICSSAVRSCTMQKPAHFKVATAERESRVAGRSRQEKEIPGDPVLLYLVTRFGPRGIGERASMICRERAMANAMQ
jgi:hypothetical protein